MIKVNAKAFAMLSKYIETNKNFEISVEKGATLRDVLRKLGLPEDEIFTCTINGENATLDDEVKDGDNVGFYPYLGGG
ncbi:MAG: MoaD/ThiS family protein [Caloramator sp.]|nr:MoaD/ThiS family protein [Caloramator sp.]